MNRVFALLFFMLVYFVSTGVVSAEKSIKIGVVDVEQIVKSLPEATIADKQLNDIAQAYRDSLASMEKIFGERLEKYNKQKAMMTPDQQKKEEESIQKIQIDYQRFQQEKFGQQGEIAQMRESLLAPIRDKVREAIKKVAEKEGMSFVLDKASITLLYSEDQFDVTFSVLDLLKRGAVTPEKPGKK